MNRYTIHLMTVYMTWEDIEAESEDEAIKQCEIPAEFDSNEPFTFIATEQEKEDEQTRTRDLP